MSIAAPYDARAVANFFLDFGDARGVKLTQVTLLKLLYFAHGWYLVEFGKPLILHDFEAWEYGPVVKVVRDAFKHVHKEPITDRARRLILQTGELATVPPVLSPDDALFVQRIFEEYAHLGAWRLSDMTHEPGSPWDRLWNPQESIGRLGLRIKNGDIRDHFAMVGKRVRAF